MLPTPELRYACTLEVELGPIREMGMGRGGKRRIIPIVGGSVSGPRLSGRIRNVGADWQTIFEDGIADLDTRYAFETHDGAVIEIVNRGFRHGPPDVLARLAAGEDCAPESYYMRTSARLETGDPRYMWVNRMIFIGTGARFRSAVRIDLYEVG